MNQGTLIRQRGPAHGGTGTITPGGSSSGDDNGGSTGGSGQDNGGSTGGDDNSGGYFTGD